LFNSTGFPEISVVVPTYRRPAMLARCLAALLGQDIHPARYEIIVCDDGPDEATRQTVEAFALESGPDGCAVKYVPITQTQGPAGARNRGWRVARADVIAFTDDDTIPDGAWLRQGLRAMAGGAGAASGRIRVPLGTQPTDYELDAAGLGSSEFATANCFVRRDLLRLVGGFDERYTAAWREDSDLQFSLLEAGATIVDARWALVEHPVRPAQWGVSIRQQKKAQFDALLYKKHRRFFLSRIPAAPWVYYLITVCFIAALTGALAGSAGITVAALAVWVVFGLLFAAQRLRHTSRTASHIAEMVATSLLIPPLSVFWRLYGALKFRVGFW
jgi:glycosyltransferase involved in cell wall biosynthesis